MIQKHVQLAVRMKGAPLLSPPRHNLSFQQINDKI